MLVLVALAALLTGLTIFALLRPWAGLILLLALLPFNGFLSDVVAPTLKLSSTASTMLAAWHDSIAIGIIAVAVWARIRGRNLRPSSFEVATGVVLASAVVSLILAPHLVAGLYAYRTLYEPICLAVAVVALAKERGLPSWVPPTAATAIVLSGVVASLFAIWQVYGGGYSYLRTFEVRGGHLPTAYLAAFVNQPRAFGTFHSPNEFGAVLALAVILVLSPAIVRLPPTARAWAAAALGFAQFLSLSRSSWVALSVAIVIVVVLLPVTRSGLRDLVGELRRPRTWGRFALPLATFALLTSIVIVGSGATRFFRSTFSGQDPSSAEHVSQLSRLLPGVTIDQPGGPSGSSAPGPSGSSAPGPSGSSAPGPSGSSAPGSSGSSAGGPGIFGLGLGAAGPKSTRFDAGPSGSLINSEVWYVNYSLQTGYVGLIALFVLFGVAGRGLWKRRRNSLSRAALAIGAGLLVGALFIPVLDEPALAIPIWAIIGLGLANPPGEPAGPAGEGSDPQVAIAAESGTAAT